MYSYPLWRAVPTAYSGALPPCAVEAGDAAEATALFYTASLSGFDYQAFTCRSWI
jgi:hypothetical protein